jgi:SAM-dependent methyltransferase
MGVSRLHCGCGNIILDGFINLDRAPLRGVQVVHDLSDFPWPFTEMSFDHLIMVDVLEHLPSVTRTMEEIHRITRPGGRITIRVPYYNAWDASFDPTHLHSFNENSFDFFDPRTVTGKTRSYYADCRFEILTVGYLVRPLRSVFLLCDSDVDAADVRLPPPYGMPLWRSSAIKKCTTHIAHKFGNVIRTLHIELTRL